MTGSFDFAVVGRGMMGTACARWLAEGGASVALIGPDEPADPRRHKAPFGSFHDAGRISRRIASSPDWALLAARSVDRYAALETGGIPFFTPCGAMMAGPVAGPMAGFMAGVQATAHDIPHVRHDSNSAAHAFPGLNLPKGSLAVWEAGGGYIDPRAYRAALERVAVARGAQVITHHATGLSGPKITLTDGSHVSAGHVVVATGGYARTDGLLPARPAMRVYARTVTLARISAVEAARLSSMPSLIYYPDGLAYDLYVLPPIRYPDGHFTVKIGGQDDSPLLETDAGMTAWFQSDGDAAAGAYLLDHLRALMPGLAIDATRTAPCAVSFTATDMPYIERLDDNLTLLTGGNGAAAKCADELGRLGALAATGTGLSGEGYHADFRAVLV